MLPRYFLTSCCTLALVATAGAQHMTSSPRGFESTEGNMSFDLIGSSAALRYQQIDATTGAKMMANVAFRRDGLLPTNAAYVARTVDMEMLMGLSSVNQALPHMPANYLSPTVTVLNRKQVSFPDWTAAPATAPATPDLVIPLDVMWNYAGVTGPLTDFLWEVRVYSTSSTASYPMDGDGGIPSNWVNTGTVLGPAGCIATGGSQPASLHTEFYNWKSKFSADFHVQNGLPLAATTLMLAPQDAALSHPLLCTTLHTAPAISAPIGATDPTGHLHFRVDSIPYTPSVIGIPVFAQAASLDVGQPPPALPILLTDGKATSFPIDPPTVPRVVHMYTNSATFHHSSVGVAQGGIVLHTSHP